MDLIAIFLAALIGSSGVLGGIVAIYSLSFANRTRRAILDLSASIQNMPEDGDSHRDSLRVLRRYTVNLDCYEREVSDDRTLRIVGDLLFITSSFAILSYFFLNSNAGKSLVEPAVATNIASAIALFPIFFFGAWIGRLVRRQRDIRAMANRVLADQISAGEQVDKGPTEATEGLSTKSRPPAQPTGHPATAAHATKTAESGTNTPTPPHPPQPSQAADSNDCQ
jgi:hypothetical protein